MFKSLSKSILLTVTLILSTQSLKADWKATTAKITGSTMATIGGCLSAIVFYELRNGTIHYYKLKKEAHDNNEHSILSKALLDVDYENHKIRATSILKQTIATAIIGAALYYWGNKRALIK